MGPFDRVTSYLFGSDTEQREDLRDELTAIREDIEHIEYLVSTSSKLETARAELDNRKSQLDLLRDELEGRDSELHSEAVELSDRLVALSDTVDEKIARRDDEEPSGSETEQVRQAGRDDSQTRANRGDSSNTAETETSDQASQHLVSTIDGVSPQLAKVLYDAGFETRKDVEEAQKDELQAVDKLGATLAAHLAVHGTLADKPISSTADGTFHVNEDGSQE